MPEHSYVAWLVKVGPAGKIEWGEKAVSPDELALLLKNADKVRPSTLLISIAPDADCGSIPSLRATIEKNFDCEHNDCRLAAPMPNPSEG